MPRMAKYARMCVRGEIEEDDGRVDDEEEGREEERRAPRREWRCGMLFLRTERRRPWARTHTQQTHTQAHEDMQDKNNLINIHQRHSEGSSIKVHRTNACGPRYDLCARKVNEFPVNHKMQVCVCAGTFLSPTRMRSRCAREAAVYSSGLDSMT